MAAAEQLIGRTTAAETILTLLSVENVSSGIAEQAIGTAATVNLVPAIPAMKTIPPGASSYHVVAGSSADDVVAAPAPDHVAATAPVNDVSPRSTDQYVVTARALDGWSQAGAIAWIVTWPPFSSESERADGRVIDVEGVAGG
jgi:hypothetical protein